MTEPQTYYIGQVLEPDQFPVIEDIYRVDVPAPTRWFVVQTNPNCEGKAEAGLIDVKADTYTPRLRKWQRIQPRQRTKHGPAQEAVTRLLFPGYVFMGWSWAGEPPWFKLRAVEGVRAILRPWAARQMTIEILNLRSAEMRGEFDGCAKQGRKRSIGRFVPQFVSMSEADRVRWLMRHVRGLATERDAA